MLIILKTLLCIILFIDIYLTDGKAIVPEADKLSHDIAAGRSLYYNFKQIVELNTTNFRNYVYNKDTPKTWVIEFYNSWCGHCHRFAPVIMNLAVDIYNWRDVVVIAAVDCSNDVNNQLCRDYEIMAYPSMKLIPIYSPETFLGDEFIKSQMPSMKLSIIRQLIREEESGKKRPNLNLLPYNRSDLTDLWVDIPESVNYTFLVIVNGNLTPYLGVEVALDLSSVKTIHVKNVYSSNSEFLSRLPANDYPTVYCVKRNGFYELLTLGNSGDLKNDIHIAIQEYLNTSGIVLPMKLNVSVKDLGIDVLQIMERLQLKKQLEQKLKSQDISDVVFQVDLEGALRYSLYHEIALKNVIDDDKLDALKNYLIVLSKYFPISSEGKKFLKAVKDEVLSKSVFYGRNVSEFAKSQEKIFDNNVFLSEQSWIGCQGSEPKFRGYPCSLWTLFHTLTVQAELKKDLYPESDPQEVLKAMVGYIKNFFGCSDCSDHFKKMAVTMTGNVSSLDDSILWLWKAHNSANLRLSGDLTEDPQHKKIQFPSPQSCPNCRDSNTNDWIIPNVLHFLKSMYTNISYFQWSDLSSNSLTTEKSRTDTLHSKRLVHQNYASENEFSAKDNEKLNNEDFNIFDISLCVLLYVGSVVILLLVCIKFIMRKSHKKKNAPEIHYRA